MRQLGSKGVLPLGHTGLSGGSRGRSCQPLFFSLSDATLMCCPEKGYLWALETGGTSLLSRSPGPQGAPELPPPSRGTRGSQPAGPSRGWQGPPRESQHPQPRGQGRDSANVVLFRLSTPIIWVPQPKSPGKSSRGHGPQDTAFEGLIIHVIPPSLFKYVGVLFPYSFESGQLENKQI